MNDHTASTALDPVISRYLAHRRALGRQYDLEEHILHSLTDFLVQVGESDLSGELFDSWCRTFDSLNSTVRRARQVAVRNFCLYRQRTEPRCFVPDINRFARPQPPAAPIITTPAQIGRLLELAGTREPKPTSPLRPHVLRLALVLLYTAGLRRSELVRLTLADVDAHAGVLRVRESKFHKSRWVPLSSGARRELRRYLVYRLAPRSTRCRHHRYCATCTMVCELTLEQECVTASWNSCMRQAYGMSTVGFLASTILCTPLQLKF